MYRSEFQLLFPHNLNRFVFRLLLKVARVSAVLTSMGRSFHHHGARTDSSRDREVEAWRRGGIRQPAVAERRGLAGV